MLKHTLYDTTLKKKEERVYRKLSILCCIENSLDNFPAVCNCNLVFFLSSARRFYSQSRIITIYMLFIFRIGNCNTVVMGKAKFLFIIANLYFVSMAFVFNKYLGVFFFLTYVHFKRLNDNYFKKKIIVDFFRLVYIQHSVYSLVFGLDFFFSGIM